MNTADNATEFDTEICLPDYLADPFYEEEDYIVSSKVKVIRLRDSKKQVEQNNNL